jgi:hypothetical protein
MLISRYYDDEIKGYGMDRECSRHGRRENYMQAFGTKLEGNRTLGRSRLR